jgi:hypothetical protein
MLQEMKVFKRYWNTVVWLLKDIYFSAEFINKKQDGLL